MSETLVLGAPSLRGEDARDTLDKQLAALKFPLTAKVVNHQPFHVSFPAADSLYLRPSGHVGDTGQATFNDAATFARFVTDVQAVADLHKIEVALTITFTSESRPAQASKPATPKPTAKPED